MDLSSPLLTHFIIYLGVIRLGIISAGIISMVLGYKLLTKESRIKRDAGEGSSLEAEIAGSRFVLKNAASGTIFTAIGTGIVIVMLIISGPGMTLKNIKEAGTGETTETALVLRSSEVSKLNRINNDYRDGISSAEKAYDDLYELFQEAMKNSK